MTVAEETRAAVRERPFLYDALAAGVVNYAAAAGTLGLDADPDAVATALRRFADELDADGGPADGVRVTMLRGLGRVDVDGAAGEEGGTDPADGVDAADGPDEADRTDGADAATSVSPGAGAAVLSVGGVGYAADAGDAAAVIARGDAGLGPAALERVLGRLRTAGVAAEAAGATADALVVVVGRRRGADALRAVEAVVDG